jgi:predicted DNA-binding transcriptional regulator YafY
LFAVTVFDQLLKQYRNTPLESNLKGAFSKILNALPDNVTINSAFLPSETSFIPDPPAIEAEVFELIFTALKTKQTITIDYRSLGETSY